MEKHTFQNGFTLLEVLGALTTMSFAIALICTTLLSSHKSLRRSQQRFLFHEQLEAQASELISGVSNPAITLNGAEEKDNIMYSWQIDSAQGLVSLHISAKDQRNAFQSQLECLKSAWLQRLHGGSHE